MRGLVYFFIISINSKFALTYNERSIAYCGIGRFRQAIKNFRKFFKLNLVLIVSQINECLAFISSFIELLKSQNQRLNKWSIKREHSIDDIHIFIRYNFEIANRPTDIGYSALFSSGLKRRSF